MRESELVAALADGWGLGVRSATYRPVGFGSYHWAVADDEGRAWFVTADDLGREHEQRDRVFGVLGRALGTALALRRAAGLEFVVAPVPTLAGSALWRANPRYAVSVFPLLEGEAGQFGPHRPQDRADVVELLVRLHRATPVVATAADRADLALPGRAGLESALRGVDRAWVGGPYSEPARRLLAARADRVQAMLADFDRLVAVVRDGAGPWVVTHGEPHPGNVMRTPDGLHLIDWDTVRIAPPERDLWLIADDDSDEVIADYTEATGWPVDPAGLALFRLRWTLADIAAYVDELRGPHQATADTAASLRYLAGYLDGPHHRSEQPHSTFQ
jgi:spectinomycin phosphotransferase